MTGVLTGKDFVAQLQEEMRHLFDQLGDTETLESESEGQVEVKTLLRLALTSELEASEIAAYWMPSTPEVEAKLVLAHQCGDEMKHYALISRRLEELGDDLSDFDPFAGGHSALYQYLRPLRRTVERIAAGPFAGEAVAEIRNAQFIAFCRSIGDEETARLYAETIQPEEVRHHHLAADVLANLCDTAEKQELAANAARTALAIADELRLLAEKNQGLPHVPMS
ncbi:MAG: ferritin-like domain-containing protein [Acidobacteriota bacterium]